MIVPVVQRAEPSPWRVLATQISTAQTPSRQYRHSVLLSVWSSYLSKNSPARFFNNIVPDQQTPREPVGE